LFFFCLPSRRSKSWTTFFSYPSLPFFSPGPSFFFAHPSRKSKNRTTFSSFPPSLFFLPSRAFLFFCSPSRR
jgi:hypothetical protein